MVLGRGMGERFRVGDVARGFLAAFVNLRIVLQIPYAHMILAMYLS